MSEKESCTACREQLIWYLADQLSGAGRVALEGHLAACARCRQELAQWRTVQETLLQEDQRIPPDLRAEQEWERLRTRIPEQPRRSGRQHQARPSGEKLLLEYEKPGSTNHAAGVPRAEEWPKRNRLALPRLAWIPAVAVMLVIILVSVLLFNRSSLVPHRSTASSTIPLLPVSTAAPLPTQILSRNEVLSGVVISAVQMLSANDGWAVGDFYSSYNDPPGSAILHYDGSRWSLVGNSLPNMELFSISMLSADEGWAVGQTEYADSVVLHYLNGQWVRVPSPQKMGLFQLHMLSSSEGWAVGVQFGTGGKPFYILMHFQNGLWSQVDDGNLPLTVLSLLSANNGWAVGNNGVIARYQYGQWTSWPATAPGDLTSLQMLAATDGWAAGVAPHALFQDSPRTLFLLHYDGNTWAPVRLPAMAQYANSLSQLTGFAFVSPSEGWAIGGGQSLPLGLAGCQAGSSSCQDTSEVSILLHYIGGHWKVVTMQVNAFLDDISMISANEGWAVGMTADPNNNGNSTATVMLHYHNGTWSVYNQWSQ